MRKFATARAAENEPASVAVEALPAPRQEDALPVFFAREDQIVIRQPGEMLQKSDAKTDAAIIHAPLVNPFAQRGVSSMPGFGGAAPAGPYPLIAIGGADVSLLRAVIR